MNDIPARPRLSRQDNLSPLLRPASRRGAIDPFIVMDVMQAAAEFEAAGGDVIHMEVGQPATAAPEAARQAVDRAMRTGPLGYTLALGIPELRQRIARHYLDRYGVKVPADRIVVTTGSSAAFLLAFLSLFDVGDRLALPVPGYPCYRHIATALGLNAVPVVTGAAERWMPTPEKVARLVTDTGARGLLLASPANPTGTMLEPARLAAIVRACVDTGMWFISDEIYHGLAYAQPEATALAISDQVIVINSFSKYFSMTGWRVGWMVVPQGLVRQVERLAQNLFICPPAVAQVAALGAFDGIDELERNRRVYAANRDLLLRELPQAGLDQIVPADGAFYLYVDVGAFTNDAVAFAKAMLEEIGVAATPGVDFDPDRGNRFLRFSYAGSMERMAEAARRIHDWPRLRQGRAGG